MRQERPSASINHFGNSAAKGASKWDSDLGLGRYCEKKKSELAESEKLLLLF